VMAALRAAITQWIDPRLLFGCEYDDEIFWGVRPVA
jgi:hypothetical protein